MKNWEKKSSCFVAGNKLDKGSSREAGKRIESVWVKDCFCSWCTLIFLAVRNKSTATTYQGFIKCKVLSLQFFICSSQQPLMLVVLAPCSQRMERGLFVVVVQWLSHVQL